MTSKIKMSISPSRGDFNPKNNNDHKAFRINWIANTTKKTFLVFDFNSSFQTMYKDTPIRKYKIIQTGPNIQLGGAKKGFSNVIYQSGTASKVNKEPNIPAD